MIKSKAVLPVLFGCFAALLAGVTHALPALQLGPTGYPPAPPGWTYNTSTDTWDYVGGVNSVTQISAYANAENGSGDYAWDASGTPQYAYLVVSTVPDLGISDTNDPNFDNFNISLTGGTLVTSGYGNPPLEDNNDLAPHGIFNTYFEIYEFQFNGSIGTISNTEPPNVDTGAGYAEDLTITINSLITGVTGLHFDIFTTTGSGNSATWLGETDKQLVYATGPFSHDVQWNPMPPDTDPNPVPVPGTLLLLGLGLAGLALAQRPLLRR